MDAGVSLIVAVFLLIVAFFVTFIPSFVAFRRNHKNRIPILILNIFLGWTGIGWVICLVWAFTNWKRS